MKQNTIGKCIICVSPYRREIEQTFNSGLPVPRIFAKYKELLRYTASKQAFYQLLIRHKKGGHTGGITILQAEAPTGIKSATIESFGRRMLDLGMAKIEEMNPQEVQLKDVIQAQKLVLDSKKLKITEDVMVAMMGKLFGPRIDTTKAIEGETT